MGILLSHWTLTQLLMASNLMYIVVMYSYVMFRSEALYYVMLCSVLLLAKDLSCSEDKWVLYIDNQTADRLNE